MIHKDYLFPAHIQINITKEKVEIINPGKLLFPKSEFGKTSAYRNPILADLLLRTGDIEKIGSGIKRIKKLCKEENIKVSFETNEIFRTTFYRNQAKTTQKSDVNPTQIRRKSRTISSEIELKSLLKELNIEWSEEWSEKWSEKWSELTKRRKQILILIINNPNITRTQLSEKLKINPSAIQKHIDLLKEKKIIIREGPDKGGSWRITK
jgi:ATP-dependent DNA helicase RecG